MTEIDPSLPHFAVRSFLAAREPGPDFDRQFAVFAGLPTGPSYSTDLNEIIAALNAKGWWWHLSHMDASVIPTTPVEGSDGMLSNGTSYDREGRPISYHSHFARDAPALSLCTAWLKAVYDLPDAFYVQASAKENAMAKEPRSRASMMAYYKAREDQRQRLIKDLARP